MNKFTNIYTFAKEKTAVLLKFKKPVETVKEEKKENNWIKRCYRKYEEAQNMSYEYVMGIYNKIKGKTRTACVSFAFLKFDEHREYATLPWYIKLYLIIKYQVCRCAKIEKIETPVISNGIIECEKKTHRVELNRRIESSFSTNETSAKSIYSDESNVNFISFRNSKKWESTNSEGVNKEENNPANEKSNVINYNVFSRSRAMTFINSFLLFHKNSTAVEVGTKNEDINEVTETDINKKKETTTVNENTFDNANVESCLIEDISISSEKNLNQEEEELGVINNIKKLNFRNAFTEINKLIF